MLWNCADHSMSLLFRQQLVGSGRLTNSVGRGPASADPRDAAHQFLKYWTSLCHEPMEESQRRQLQILSYSSVRSRIFVNYQ